MLLAECLLLSAQGFLLLAELLLFTAEFLGRGEEFHGAFNGGGIGDHVGLSVTKEPDEIAGILWRSDLTKLEFAVGADGKAVAWTDVDGGVAGRR